MFLHAFKQAGLCTWYGAVDFVGQQHVGDDGTRSKGKRGRLLIIDVESSDIRGHEIGCKLHPVKLAADAFGQTFGQNRLVDSRYFSLILMILPGFVHSP